MLFGIALRKARKRIKRCLVKTPYEQHECQTKTMFTTKHNAPWHQERY